MYPLLEFDPSRAALLEPHRLIQPLDQMPAHVVACFFQDVLVDLHTAGALTRIACLHSEIGDHPVYELAVGTERVAVFHPGVGAPLAAGMLEEVIALGGQAFIACGGAGSLDAQLSLGHILVPTAAIRDEGTSYHYLPPSREVAASVVGVAAIEAVLQERGVPYRCAKTWTTDAIYRETPAKIQARRAEGCLTVEMEAAAFFAVAQFRGVPFAQLLYSGDDLSGAEWDARAWNRQRATRTRLFELAVAACLRIERVHG